MFPRTFLKLYKSLKSRFHWFFSYIFILSVLCSITFLRKQSSICVNVVQIQIFSYKLEPTLNANLSNTHQAEIQFKSYHCSFSLKQTQFDKLTSMFKQIYLETKRNYLFLQNFSKFFKMAQTVHFQCQ